MGLFNAIDTITRRQSTTNGGGGSTSSEFLNLISNPFESSVSHPPEPELELALIDAVSNQCFLGLARHFRRRHLPSSPPLLLRSPSTYPSLCPKDKICGPETCPSSDGERTIFLDPPSSENKGRCSSRQARPRCRIVPSIHPDAAEYVLGIECVRLSSHDPGQCGGQG